eukprot:sb/3463837/
MRILFMIQVWVVTIRAGMVCDHHGDKQIYRIPPHINCTEGNYEQWNIKMQKLNNNLYSTKLKSLKIIARKCSTYTTLVGGKISEKTEKYVSIPLKEAKTLIKQHSCLKTEGSNFKLKNGYECEYSYMKHKTKTTYSCYLEEGTVSKKRGGQITSNVLDLHGCNYNEGECKTQNTEYAVWEVDTRESQQYEDIGEYNATKLGNHLIIPKLAMTVQLDGNETINEGHKITVGELIITRLRGEKPQTLQIRSNEAISIEKLKQDLDRKFQYVFDVLSSPTAEEKFSCRDLALIRRNERILARSNPTEYIREKLKVNNLIAKSVGSYIIVFPCKKVFKNSVRKSDKCYIDTPVNFRITRNSDELKGFITNYGEIISSSVEIPCNNAGKYVLIGEELALQTSNNTTIVRSEQIEDLHGEVRKGIPFPNEYPKDAWTHKETKFDQDDGIKSWIKNRQEVEGIVDLKNRVTTVWDDIKLIINYGIWCILLMIVLTGIIKIIKSRERKYLTDMINKVKSSTTVRRTAGRRG